MGKSAVLSGLLHLAVILLAIFGLPWLYEPTEVMEATPVALVTPEQLAQMTATKKPAAQKQTKPEKPKAEPAIPPAPKAPDLPEPIIEPEPAPPPEPEPQPQAEPEPAPAAQPQPEPQPAALPQPEAQDQQQQQVAVAPPAPPQPEPQPVVPQEPKVAEAQARPLPPQKPKPPKKKELARKDKPKEQPLAEGDASFLKNLEAKLKKKQTAAQQQPAANQQAALPQDDYNGPPLSEGEKDMIRQQIQANWIIDIGMQCLDEMTVDVKVQMNPDGSVVSAKADPDSSNGHPNWPIFARSCERAVLKSSPLRMPPDKPYAAWATMTLVFNAREMLGL